MRFPVSLRVALTALTISCAQKRVDPPSHAWPAESWPVSTPEQQGMDSEVLAFMLEQVAEKRLPLHSMLVVRHGHVVLDVRYFPYDGRRPHDMASCTKSLTSTAIGVALENGAIESLAAPVAGFFADRTIANDDERKRAMTLAHALTMTAGFSCVAEPIEQTLFDMTRSSDWVGFTLDLPMSSAPGSTWQYCSSVFHLLSGITERASGENASALLTRTLFEPIGVRDLVWPSDANGVSHGWGDARLFPDDLARVGYLFLRRGVWDGRRILASEWVANATTNQVGALGPTEGYGLGWWKSVGDAFYARGRGGQFLYVIPSLDLVLVTTGSVSPDEIEVAASAIADQVFRAARKNVALEPNPAANERLDELVAAAAHPPVAKALPPAPATAAAATGKRFVAGENLFGWSAFTFTFEASEATLDLEVGDTHATLGLGLDGVPRITNAVRFGATRELDDVDVALAAEWADASSLLVSFDTIDRVHAGTMRFTFDPGGIDVRVDERTFPLQNLTFRAISP